MMNNMQTGLIYSSDVFEQQQVPGDLFFLGHLEELIELTYRSNLDLEFYSQKLNISERRLNRLTVKIFGKTVYELIQDRLHQEAVNLMTCSALSAKQIAHDLGVCDAAYFSRCFKKRTGLSPREYRKAARISRSEQITHSKSILVVRKQTQI